MIIICWESQITVAICRAICIQSPTIAGDNFNLMSFQLAFPLLFPMGFLIFSSAGARGVGKIVNMPNA